MWQKLKINIRINESHSLELWSWLFEPGGQLQEWRDECALFCELVFRIEVWGVSALSGALGKNGTDEGESEKLEQSQGIISVSFFLSL